jgi:hypothetical protein
MYPFLFFKDATDPTHQVDANQWWVIIAKTLDYRIYDSSWMDNQLGDECYIPDVDLSESYHRFDTEAQAIQFIRNWWQDN